MRFTAKKLIGTVMIVAGVIAAGTTTDAKEYEIQAPRTDEDVQAPRTDDEAQAPRSDEVPQAPRATREGRVDSRH